MLKNQYWRSANIGKNAEIYVGGAQAYTTDATIKDFTDNAPDGEVGVYNADTGALLSGILNAAAGTRAVFLLKRDGLVVTSSPFTIGAANTKITKQDYAAPAKQVTTLTNTGTIAVGDELAIKIVSLEYGGTPFDYRSYSHVAKSTTLATEMGLLIAAINRDKENFVVASASGNNIVLTAKNFDVAFRVSYTGKMGAISTQATGTKAVHGSGTPEQVAMMERQGLIFQGWRTEYPDGGTSAAEMGMPTSQVSASETYGTILIKTNKTEVSPTPVNLHHHEHLIILALGVAQPYTAVSIVVGATAEPE